MLTLILLIVAWVGGLVIGAFLLVQSIIILIFGLPFTFEMKQRGVLTSATPAWRYLVWLILLGVLFVAASWVVWHFWPKYIWGYGVGVGMALLLGVGRCGHNEANVTDFFRTNAKYVDQEALARYLGQGQ